MCRGRLASYGISAPSCPTGPARRLHMLQQQACPFAASARGRPAGPCVGGEICGNLPLHRKIEIYARKDIDINWSTLANMVGQVAALVCR